MKRNHDRIHYIHESHVVFEIVKVFETAQYFFETLKAFLTIPVLHLNILSRKLFLHFLFKSTPRFRQPLTV